MGAGFFYKGKEHDIETKRDFAEFVQMLATDLGAKYFQDQNRDMWLRDFSTNLQQEIAKLRKAVPALSVASLFPRNQQAQIAGTTQASPAPAIPVSPHRVPSPTGESLDSSLNSVLLSAESTDRAHSMTLDFAAAFTATNNVGRVTFKTPYSSAPVVMLSQLDQLPLRNFRVVSVSASEYVFTCDAFPGAELHIVQALVVHPSDSFD